MIDAILEDETDVVEDTVKCERVLVATVTAVAEEDFMEKHVVADAAPRFRVRACGRSSTVGCDGSLSRGLPEPGGLLFEAGGMALSGFGGSLLLPGGPVKGFLCCKRQGRLL